MDGASIIQLIGQLIGTLGFPIVMCLILLKFLNDEQKTHKEEVSSLKDAINDLALTLAGIRAYIGGETK